jgi:type III restriction enzyme
LRGFYPDFIVRYKDGRIGIYDTKAGITVTDKRTYAKSDALQAYIAKHEGLSGGILNKRSDGIYIFEGTEYTPNLEAWTRFTI